MNGNIILHFASYVCVLYNKYFSIVKSFKNYFVVGSVIIGSVGRWVGGRLVDGQWVVGRWI